MKDIKSFEPLWGVWHIENILGEGSFGKVYKAFREEFGKKYYCAIKHISIPQNENEIKQILKDNSTDDLNVASVYYHHLVSDITNEINTMYSLSGNTNIVTYQEHLVLPKENGVGFDIFIKMELLTELSDRVREQSLTQQEVVKLGIDICTALEICAAKKLIHRDIKPQNIFISKEGNYKLGDFGISRQLEKTSSGLSKKGTYAYMAPEVYKGDDYGANVDICSLGLVMYRLLNGIRLPFLPLAPNPVRYDDDNKAMARRMRGETIPAPALADEALSAIILKMCAYNRSERYKSASEAKSDLLSLDESDKETPMIPPVGEDSLTDENKTVIIFPEPNENEQTKGLFPDNSSKSAVDSPPIPEDEPITEESQPPFNEEEPEREQTPSSKEKTEQTPSNKKRIAIISAAACLMIPLLIWFFGFNKTTPITTSADLSSAEPLETSEHPVDTTSEPAQTIENTSETVQINIETTSMKVPPANESKPVTTPVASQAAPAPSKPAVEYVRVPNFIGKTATEATAQLKSLGLVVATENKVDDSKAAGIVLAQSIDANQNTVKGSTVKLTVSVSSGSVSVPNVVGKTETVAKNQLTSAGLAVRTNEVFHNTVAKGTVISQNPASNQRVAKGTTVTISVSKGKQSVIISFNPVGGSAAPQKTVYINDTYGALPATKKDYHTLSGWYTEASGGSKVENTTKVTSTANHTLYARWILNKTSGWVSDSAVPAGAQITNCKWSYTVTTGAKAELKETPAQATSFNFPYTDTATTKYTNIKRLVQYREK